MFFNGREFICKSCFHKFMSVGLYPECPECGSTDTEPYGEDYV